MTHFEQKTGIFDQKMCQKVIKKWPKMVIFGVTPKTPKLRKSRFCGFCAFRVKKCQLEPKNPKNPIVMPKKGVKNDPKMVIFWWFFWPRSTFLDHAQHASWTWTQNSENGQKTSFLGRFLTPLFHNLVFTNNCSFFVLFSEHIIFMSKN